MSDKFSKSSLCFEQEIMPGEPEISYAAKANINNIIFALDVPFPLLKEWDKILSSKPTEAASNENFVTRSEVLKLINYSCTDDPISLNQLGQVHVF